MINFRQDILNEFTDEYADEYYSAIIMVTGGSGVADSNNKFPRELLNKPVLLKEVIGCFDYEYDEGYGTQECHDFYIWTITRILFIHEYDGSTYIESVPRHPVRQDTQCPNCGSNNLVNHQDPREKEIHEEHWYCKDCNSDFGQDTREDDGGRK